MFRSLVEVQNVSKPSARNFSGFFNFCAKIFTPKVYNLRLWLSKNAPNWDQFFWQKLILLILIFVLLKVSWTSKNKIWIWTNNISSGARTVHHWTVHPWTVHCWTGYPFPKCLTSCESILLPSDVCNFQLRLFVDLSLTSWLFL